MKFREGYCQSLSGSDLARYKAIVKLCNNIDPFEVDINFTIKYDGTLIPYISLKDVFDYLMIKMSAWTIFELASYKKKLLLTFF